MRRAFGAPITVVEVKEISYAGSGGDCLHSLKMEDQSGSEHEGGRQETLGQMKQRHKRELRVSQDAAVVKKAILWLIALMCFAGI